MGKKEKIRGMFDSIAGKYDLLNHLLSAGIDIYWRNRAVKLTDIKTDSRILDIACGTGDFSNTLFKKGYTNLTGGDLSINMLKIFNNKCGFSRGRVVHTEAEKLPFKNNVFNNIVVAFGVRNFYDIPASFRIFKSLLAPGGKVTILEFSLPKNFFARKLYMFYFMKLLPFIGKIVSKDKGAYTYLPESVIEFDSKVDLVKLLKNQGFAKVNKYSLTFGIVQIVIGEV